MGHDCISGYRQQASPQLDRELDLSTPANYCGSKESAKCSPHSLRQEKVSQSTDKTFFPHGVSLSKNTTYCAYIWKYTPPVVFV